MLQHMLDTNMRTSSASASRWFDLLIGAHAEGLTAVTNNARKFRRLPGVQVESRVDDGGAPR